MRYIARRLTTQAQTPERRQTPKKLRHERKASASRYQLLSTGAIYETRSGKSPRTNASGVDEREAISRPPFRPMQGLETSELGHMERRRDRLRAETPEGPQGRPNGRWRASHASGHVLPTRLQGWADGGHIPTVSNAARMSLRRRRWWWIDLFIQPCTDPKAS